MATFNERFEKTKVLIEDDCVTPLEGFVYLYEWIRFEWHLSRRNHHATIAKKFGDKLNANLDVIGFRKELTDL